MAREMKRLNLHLILFFKFLKLDEKRKRKKMLVFIYFARVCVKPVTVDDMKRRERRGEFAG